MAVIAYTDVATAIGRPISDTAEQEQVRQWIDDVEMLIGARLGDLTELDQDLLAYAIREAVIARMRLRSERNSDAATEVGVSEDGFFVHFLHGWWSLLTPDEDGVPVRAYSVPLGGPDVWETA